MTKKILTVLLFGFVSIAPLFAQKFTKREQQRREARENYYFCGNMFTFTTGYNHSWLIERDITLSSPGYGKKEKMGNTNNRFNVGFLWDHALHKSKKWSLQTGIYYSMKGGDHMYYYDNKFGLGLQRRNEETEEFDIQCAEATVLWRRAFNLPNPKQRITLNFGPYVSKFIDAPEGIGNWDFGVSVGVGYDFNHWSASVTYQPGVYPNIADGCTTRQANLMFNIGWRIWKK